MAEKREIGRTGVRVPAIGFGTAGIGDMPETYGYGVDEARALATVRAVLDDAGRRSSTAARNYGMGRAEERIGKVVRELGGWPEGRVLSHQARPRRADRAGSTRPRPGARWRRAWRRWASTGWTSCTCTIPSIRRGLDEIAGKDGALAELFRMRDEGLASAVGLAAGRIDVMMPLLRDWDFDALITHNRYTLVNRNAEPMIELAQELGIAVLNAAPYAAGALSKGASHGRYVYQEATSEMLAPVRRVEEICARHGVPLGAAALQFSLRDPAHHLDDLRRDQARAGAGDAGLGGLADRRGGLGGAPGPPLRHRRSGGDAGLQARVATRDRPARRCRRASPPGRPRGTC